MRFAQNLRLNKGESYSKTSQDECWNTVLAAMLHDRMRRLVEERFARNGNRALPRIRCGMIDYSRVGGEKRGLRMFVDVTAGHVIGNCMSRWR